MLQAIQEITLLLLCIAGLIFSAVKLVDYAIELGAKFQVSPFIIGLLVISLGTSLPEVMVVISAAFNQQSALIYGNILGSNIANITMALAPLLFYFSTQFNIDRQAKYSLLLTFSVTWVTAGILFISGELSAFAGLFLLAFIAPQLYLASLSSETSEISNEASIKTSQTDQNLFSSLAFTVIKVILFLIGLLVFAELTTTNATALALTLGLSEELIGLSIVAFGTSAPEVVSIGAAIYRKQATMGLGTILGSNFFNIALGLGLAALISPMAISADQFSRDVVFNLVLISLLAILLLYRNRWFVRVLSLAFISSYFLYLGWAFSS